LIVLKNLRKDIITRGNHGIARRWGSRLWMDNIYPDNINTEPPTNDAVLEALTYLRKRYVVKPAKIKWRMMTQFQTILNGKNK